MNRRLVALLLRLLHSTDQNTFFSRNGLLDELVVFGDEVVEGFGAGVEFGDGGVALGGEFFEALVGGGDGGVLAGDVFVAIGDGGGGFGEALFGELGLGAGLGVFVGEEGDADAALELVGLGEGQFLGDGEEFGFGVGAELGEACDFEFEGGGFFLGLDAELGFGLELKGEGLDFGAEFGLTKPLHDAQAAEGESGDEKEDGEGFFQGVAGRTLKATLVKPTRRTSSRMRTMSAWRVSASPLM